MWKVYFYNNTIDTDAERDINSRWEQDYNLQVRRIISSIVLISYYRIGTSWHFLMSILRW